MRLVMEHLSKQFKNRIAVESIDTELREGVYGFLGANGAGKTTLMQMICGIIEPTAGEVKINGENNIQMGERFRDMLGYLPQEFGYTPGFTANDFMLYIASIKGLPPRFAKRKTKELLKLVNLEKDAGRKIRTFSGGMKRRVGIAQALLNNPKVLILDEPTAGLDPQERTRFRNLLSQIGRDTIVILSTHIISDIESVAKETIMIKDGKVLLQGTHREILKDMEGKVYSLDTNDENLVSEIQNKYKVVSINRGIENISIRFISETKPSYEKIKLIEPKFEDVYMFYFDLEDAREV